MASEEQRALYDALHESQSRLTYYMLTAAAAGIALAVNQTRDAALTWSQIPLGIAALSWGLSFLFGCLHLQYVNSIIYANSELLRVQEGEDPDLIANPHQIAPALAGINKAMKKNANRAGFYGAAQFRMLVVGALLFVFWHILEMYLRR
jgi:hypothetical protein